ncbi:MAG: dipeptidase [Pacificimonas sp.]|jgi:microsomal dipeptidase-like Zn-dependent dipeptidase|nr:dipeptidase [Pacificimonas sp.]
MAKGAAKAGHGRGKRIALWTAGLVVLAAVLFFALAPGMIERSMNRVEGSGLWRVAPQVQALHNDLLVADMHADTLLWKRDLTARAGRGHVDVERLVEGNVAVQVFGSVTKTPTGQNYDSNSAESDNITPLVIGQMQPVRTWGSLLERSLYHAQKLYEAERDDDRIVVVTTADGLADVLARRQRGEGDLIAALLGVEGLHNMEGEIGNLDRLYAAGYRMAGLTHFFDNELAGSMHGEAKGGLTALGVETVQRMEDLGMIVDIAHLSRAGVAEVLAMATKPVVVSHGGAQAVCDVNRNLTDEEIRGVAATGGVIGVGFWDGAVCEPTPQATARTMRHIRDLVGIDHVGLGSDFDGAVTTGFDASGMAAVTQALVDQEFSEAEIRAVMGGNVLRLLMETLPAGR